MFRYAHLLALVGAVTALGALVCAPRVPLEVASAYASQSYSTRGVVQSIAADRASLSVQHEAIPGFMPAMTMSFEARSAEQLNGLRAGDHVAFSFTLTDDARRIVDEIHKR